MDTHLQFDLNDTAFREKWPGQILHDVVIVAEVIEHLYTSPRVVLEFIGTFTKPNGFLVIQTPNACALPKRIRMLRGQNPFEMIRETPGNPGHLREYTRREVIDVCAQCRFRLTDEILDNYFDGDTPGVRLFNLFTPLVPRTWRNGMTMCFRKV